MSWCANPDCPTKPEILESDETPYDDRSPCPICGSRARMFAVTSYDSLKFSDRAHAHIELGAGPAIQPSATASLELRATMTAAGRVDPAPARLKVSALGLDISHGVTVLYSDLSDEPDAPCAIEVHDLEGNVLVSGVGTTPANALSMVFEHMLPTTSEEYVPGDDEMPDHED